ncbi:ADP-ribosylglycohydrolase family protein [Leadbettera azotonutricia]|uniref:ADP-ribosylglycohydrolase family protein n=1 Tax=Leadbettera azotonutricia (strain ATCC BAA-888 / DSM 13862 / ZAS-9) TaxID=545695 RepID=F5YAM4_LEAAZ|nr:ADP-ribosylglycohydrolase family protein [Leadbettera azotonutricia]AEF83372.1 ADP-ribosylglycohydrolase family protein [Leadbettera azotonutricia ZAS-9]
MYGSIIGDICGSIYEWNNHVTDRPHEIELINQKCYYTDDTILTLAIANAVLSNYHYQDSLLIWTKKYPNCGYGGKFRNWFNQNSPKPYNSYGNGSAMRVGSIGWCFDTLEETLTEARKSAQITHNHKEGMKGAMAIASAIYLARNGKTKNEIKEYIEGEFKYKLGKDLSKLRKTYRFGGKLNTCQGTVPEAIMAFLESTDFENSIQIAISLGGDSDTLACITGSIAEAFYKNIPLPFIDFVNSKLEDDMKELLRKFYEKYLKNYDLEYYTFKKNQLDMYI